MVNPQYLRCSLGVNLLVSGKYTRPSSGNTHRLRRFAFSSSSGVSAVIMAMSKTSRRNLPLSSKSSVSGRLYSFSQKFLLIFREKDFLFSVYHKTTLFSICHITQKTPAHFVRVFFYISYLILLSTYVLWSNS